MSEEPLAEGIFLLDKAKGATSFQAIRRLRKILGVKKIGHAGTLDPFATGLLILMVGKKYTRLSDSLMGGEKEYEADLLLGQATDSYDCDGQVTETSSHIPQLEDLKKALEAFQGEVEQIPPMFSAKKVGGKKLYELARAGKVIERRASKVWMETTLVEYVYPRVKLHVKCSKGTYIRSIAHDLGKALGAYAHLTDLRRTRSGSFTLDKAAPASVLEGNCEAELLPYLLKTNQAVDLEDTPYAHAP